MVATLVVAVAVVVMVKFPFEMQVFRRIVMNFGLTMFAVSSEYSLLSILARVILFVGVNVAVTAVKTHAES